MKTTLFSIAICLLFLVPGNSLYSQTDTTGRELKRIVKTDGTEYLGYVISDDGREVLIETEALGKIYIPKAQISSITPVKSNDFNKSGEYDPEGPFSTRYYFTNTALPAKKGDHYSMVHLYGPEVHFACGKGFNIGVMTTWAASPFIVVARQSFKTKWDKLHLSIGTMVGTSGYLNTFKGYGAMHWGTVTIGDARNNISVGGGYLYLQTGLLMRQVVLAEGVYDGAAVGHDGYEYGLDYNPQITSRILSPMFKTPMFSLAGTAKLGPKVSFIFDSMISVRMAKTKTATASPWNDANSDFVVDPGETTITVTSTKEPVAMFFLMPGMRIQSSDRNAFQVALAGVTYVRGGDAIAFPIPQCSWFFKF